MKPRVLYLDTETQRSAAEVGGWHNARDMLLAVAVVYDALDQEFSIYHEETALDLVDHLRSAALTIAFNVPFDLAVLSPYAEGVDLEKEIPTFDVLAALRCELGWRPSLDSLAKENLGEGKGGSGLDSLRWWSEGRFDLVARYCTQDVRLLRDLFRLAVRQRHLTVSTRGGRREVSTPWVVEDLVEKARLRSGEYHEL